MRNPVLRGLFFTVIATFVVPHVSAGSAHGWIQQIAGDRKGSLVVVDTARAVVVDGAGDVVVGGDLLQDSTGGTFVVVKFDGASGAELWRRELDGTTGGLNFESAHALALDGTAVLAAGSLHNAGTGIDFVVTKLDGATGAEVWRREISGGPGGVEVALAVAVDAGGDVLAAGGIAVPGHGLDFAVLKFDGGTGAELWRRTIDLDMLTDRAVSLAVTPSGDPVAGGFLSDAVTAEDLAVVKLDGATGAEQWRRQIDGGSPFPNETAAAVRIDGSGDVVAAGRIGGAAFGAIKFDGSSGVELWRATGSGHGNALVLDSSGDAFVAGEAGDQFAVAKVDGATGVEVWRSEIVEIYDDVANAIALDPAGNPVAAGRLGRSVVASGVDDGFGVVKLDSVTGAEIWRQELRGSGSSWNDALAVAVDPSGEVVAAGSFHDARSDWDFAVAKLDGENGAVRGLAGRSLLFRDLGPAKRLFRALAKDRFVTAGAPGSTSDPTVSGATLQIANPTSAESVVFALPAAAWRGLGKPVGSKGYKFKPASGTHPCRSVVFKPGKLLRVVCNAKHGAFPFSLDEPSQGSLALSLQVGPSAPQCARFGGVVLVDTPGSFKAKNVAPGDFVCP